MGWTQNRPRRPLKSEAPATGAHFRLGWARAVAAALLLCLAAAASLAGCAGELPVPGQTSSTAARPTTSSTEAPGLLLGDQVAATWAEVVQRLVPLLEGMPPIASLRTPVSQLKEEYVQRMVALGRQIAALDEGQRQAAYDRATDVIGGTGESEWFKSYVRLYDQYAADADADSQDFAILLSTFNTLSQYAFFDTLKEQEPGEAQRLGID
jgi:hypothetical protein